MWIMLQGELAARRLIHGLATHLSVRCVLKRIKYLLYGNDRTVLLVDGAPDDAICLHREGDAFKSDCGSL